MIVLMYEIKMLTDMRKKLLFVIIIFPLVVLHSNGMSVSLSSINNVNDVCNEGHGSIGAPSIFGGVAPYTYLWSTGATTPGLTNIPAGIYTVTVTDNIGSTASASTSISNYTNLTPAPDQGLSRIACHNSCLGMWNIPDASLNGTPPYLYTSSIGSIIPYGNGAYISPICDGSTAIITVTDALGCTGSTPATMNGTPLFNPPISIVPSCNSLPNGSITVGNVAFWMYAKVLQIRTDTTSWLCGDFNGYSGPFTANNLSAGNYYLGIMFSYVDPWCSPDTWDWNAGCPQYIPFTIPDLGTNCGTIQGDVYVDLNADCIEDAGEIGVPNTIIEFIPGPYYSYTNMLGHYSTNLVWGNFNMTHYSPAVLTQLCPTNPFPVSLSSSNTNVTVNFADTSNIPFDVAAHISHGAAHPGFNFSYGVSVQNLSYTASGMLTVTLNYDPLLSFVSANPAPFSTSAGQVVWQLNSITNFQWASAGVTLNVPVGTPLGTPLSATVIVQATTAEINLANNTASTSHLVTGSFDPNVKTVESPAASFIPATQGLFNYTIQFQNTGNDTAFNVHVIDTLNSNLDVRTFIPGASSHPYTIDITGQGVLHFYFNNIYLPDSTTDEPHSHGFISFQIRSKQNLPHGTNISNKSNIIFDFNSPVATNTTQNTVDLTLAVQASATTICAGQSVTLAMIPELQNTTWRWRTGTCSGALVGNGNSIMVSPTVTTTYFVRDSAGTIPLGACYRKTIVVNSLPSASITPNGPTTFCVGGNVLLTAGGANNYLWSNSSTAQSITVSASGNYSVTVTDGNNCSASTSASVTVNQLPTATITPSGSTTFCQGDSVTLTSSTANSYLWSTSATTQSINVSSPGNYIVTVTDGNNCSSASSATAVTVNPNPPVPNITQVGTSLLSDALTGNQWYLNSVLIPGATSQSYQPTQNGNYSVVITDANGCTASSAAFPFYMTGIETLSEDDVVIYPNPARDELIVQSSKFKVQSVEVVDVVGKVLQSQESRTRNQVNVNVSSLAPGIYFVRVKGEKGIVVRRVVKG
jgi:uncharacterized repeat protein (TIGR01451 family)